MPADVQTKLFDATDLLRDGASDDLQSMMSALRLDSEQQRALRDRIAQMNTRIARSLDQLLALSTQTQPVAPREVIDALADGLNAIRETDDAFVATLDDGQRQRLRDDHFDMTTQVDPTILVTRIVAFATTWTATDDDSDETATPGDGSDERRNPPSHSGADRRKQVLVVR